MFLNIYQAILLIYSGCLSYQPNVNFVGCFVFFSHPGELALGDDSEALKPVTENPGNQGEMVGSWATTWAIH